MKVYALNTIQAGQDTIRAIARNVDLAGVIGLTRRSPTDSTSGYVWQEPNCKEMGIPFIPVQSYSLHNSQDKARLSRLDIDILIVAGWQRLVPDWLIQHCGDCAIGIHGSMNGITAGRGRSPQNWSILLQKSQFNLSIFEIDSGIDSGSIIDSAEFPISEFDDIITCYYKVSCVAAEMITRYLTADDRSNYSRKPQEGIAHYLPQRLPEDGAIDWARPSEHIHAFVRAITRPYPGAFTSSNSKQMRIWRGIPFDWGDDSRNHEPGEVVRVFSGGEFAVATSEGDYLVQECSWDDDDSTDGMSIGHNLTEGERLSSANFRMQMKNIAERHLRKYPDLPLSEEILERAAA